MRVGTLVTAVLACGTAGEAEFLDRIEGDRAVLVDGRGRQRSVPRADLPPAAAEGDVLVDLRVDAEATDRLRREVRERRARLAADDDGRDLSLEDPRP